jgi:hypothetical protein
MLEGTTAPDPQISPRDTKNHVASFNDQRASEETLVAPRLLGARRFKNNLIGMGAVERTSTPELQPNIPLPSLGFKLGMIQYDPRNGASLPSHTTEEVFTPLAGPKAVTWLNQEREQEIIMQPIDLIHTSIGAFHGLRHVDEGRGTLLPLIGGPDAVQVDWEPWPLARAAAQGVSCNAAGEVKRPAIVGQKA